MQQMETAVNSTLTANSSEECRWTHRRQTEYEPWPSSCRHNTDNTQSNVRLFVSFANCHML